MWILTLRKTGLFYLQLLHPVTIHSIPAWNLVPLEDHEKQLNTTEIFYSQIMVPPCDHSPRSWLLREHVERMYSWCSNHPEIRRARFRCRPTSRTDNCIWQDLFPESRTGEIENSPGFLFSSIIVRLVCDLLHGSLKPKCLSCPNRSWEIRSHISSISVVERDKSSDVKLDLIAETKAPKMSRAMSKSSSTRASKSILMQRTNGARKGSLMCSSVRHVEGSVHLLILTFP